MLSGRQFSDSSWYFRGKRTRKKCFWFKLPNWQRKPGDCALANIFSSGWQPGSLAARGKSEWKEEERISGVYISLSKKYAPLKDFKKRDGVDSF